MNGTEADVKERVEKAKRWKERVKLDKKNKKQNKTESSEKPFAIPKTLPEKVKKHKVDNSQMSVSNKKLKKKEASEGNQFENSSTYKKLFHKNGEKVETVHWAPGQYR